MSTKDTAPHHDHAAEQCEICDFLAIERAKDAQLKALVNQWLSR